MSETDELHAVLYMALAATAAMLWLWQETRHRAAMRERQNRIDDLHNTLKIERLRCAEHDVAARELVSIMNMDDAEHRRRVFAVLREITGADDNA